MTIINNVVLHNENWWVNLKRFQHKKKCVTINSNGY